MGDEIVRTRKGPGWPALILSVGFMLLLVVAMFFFGRVSTGSTESSSPTITEIQRLGELVVLRVNVADVLEREDPNYKGLWIIRGDALVAVDLRQAQLRSIDEATRLITVVLPQPKVVQPRVDFKRSKTYDVEKKTWWNPFADGQEEFTDQGMISAQSTVERASSAKDVISQARDQTELMLANMYRLVGWDVQVVWQGGSAATGTAK